MDSLIRSDLFFVITAVAVIIVTIGIAIVCVYVVRILIDVKKVSTLFRMQGEELIDDFKFLRGKFREKGTKFADFIDMLIGFGLKFIKSKGRSKKVKSDSENKE